MTWTSSWLCIVSSVRSSFGWMVPPLTYPLPWQSSVEAKEFNHCFWSPIRLTSASHWIKPGSGAWKPDCRGRYSSGTNVLSTLVLPSRSIVLFHCWGRPLRSCLRKNQALWAMDSNGVVSVPGTQLPWTVPKCSPVQCLSGSVYIVNIIIILKLVILLKPIFQESQ